MSYLIAEGECTATSPENCGAEGVVGTIQKPGFLGTNTVGDLVSNVYQTVLIFAGLFFLFMLSSAGLRWMSAGGDAKAKESAMSTIVNSVIGLIVVVLAWSLTVIFGRFLGISENILTDIEITNPGE